uniref:Uncharacterized protein n=1 Tax=Oryza glumipatula TaxID=40148 RepID=A0A0D9YMB6_9ORYZ
MVFHYIWDTLMLTLGLFFCVQELEMVNIFPTVCWRVRSSTGSSPCSLGILAAVKGTELYGISCGRNGTQWYRFLALVDVSGYGVHLAGRPTLVIGGVPLHMGSVGNIMGFLLP